LLKRFRMRISCFLGVEIREQQYESAQ